MKAYMLLMMGGVGERFGSDIPKQFIEIDGQPIFTYIVEKAAALDCVEGMVIVSHPEWIDFVKEWVDKIPDSKFLGVASGGKTRSNSVLNGLTLLREHADDDTCVLIHDATHPYIDEKGTLKVIEAVETYGAATLGEYQYDTVYRVETEGDEDFVAETLNRREIVAGASPEAFRLGEIYSIYANSSQEELEKMTSAGAIAQANGIKMKVIPCNVINLKITYPNDMDAIKKFGKNFF